MRMIAFVAAVMVAIRCAGTGIMVAAGRAGMSAVMMAECVAMMITRVVFRAGVPAVVMTGSWARSSVVITTVTAGMPAVMMAF